MGKKKLTPSVKLSAAKHSLNLRPTKAAGAPFNDQDPKRRLGNFGGAGEHPKQGSRSAGNRWTEQAAE